ncbi:hypothetical protein niasHT_025850 [Heterodera trifolii]|uniref:Uncharacterized protein n=1 Tax=Heterodera trifolii TaxID=157864 RepID=A0ABD2KJJ6_9BILA
MNTTTISTNNDSNDSSRKYSNGKQQQQKYSSNNNGGGQPFACPCRHQHNHKTVGSANDGDTNFCASCSYSAGTGSGGGAELSGTSSLLSNCAPSMPSQHLGVDPAKSPLSRFDLILLRSFQAVAAPAGAAVSSSICSTTSSRQSSLVSTADQQQLLQSIEFGECCSLSCCSTSSVYDHQQQQHYCCEEVQQAPPTAEDGTKNANANGDGADGDDDQLLLLSALLGSSSVLSSPASSARHGAQRWRRGTIGEQSIAEECGSGTTASAGAVDGRENEGDDDENGTDCGEHGDDKEDKKSQPPLSALLSADKTPTKSHFANANAKTQQEHQQQRTPVAKTTSCSTSSSGVSSSPNINAAISGCNNSSKISRLIVRRHSAFQLPQRFTAAASVAIGKLSGASPPPPALLATATTAQMLHLYNANIGSNKNAAQMITAAAGAGAVDDDDDNDEDEDGTTDRPTDQSDANGSSTVPPSPALSHQLTMAAAKQQLLKHTAPKSGNVDKIVDDKANVHVSMQQLLAMRDDGMELAFERCKAWSKYVSQLLQIVKLRLSTEEDYVNKLRRQSEQAKALLAVGTAQTVAANVGKMPLAGVFERMLDGTMQQTVHAECALGAMQQRVVLTLENRQKEHDQRRRKLKTEWAKQRKQLDVCVEELRRAKQTHLNKDEHYLRAKELRQEQEFPMLGTPNNGTPSQICGAVNGGSFNSSSKDQLMIRKRVKEMEKRRKAEEEALNRKSDAENDVKRLERELEERMFRIHSLRHHTVNELSDLIRQCELTTIAATSTLLKSLADLWEAVPGQFHRLADVSRSNAPGADFLSFLQSLPSADSFSSSCWREIDEVSAAAPTDHHAHPYSSHNQLRLLNNGIGTTAANHHNHNHHHHYRHNNRHHSINNGNSIATAPMSNNGGNASLSSSSAASSTVVPMRSAAVASSSGTVADAGAVPSSSVPSSSVCRVQQRRNALSSTDDAPPAKLMMTPSQHKRKGKAAEMTARLFDMQSSSSSSTPIQPSDAARSHRLARTRQVSRCSQCGQLLIFDAVKCQCCGLLSHKKCLGSVQLWCGEKTAKRLTECGADRRMSIFGVPLSESLRTQHRKVPFILERCVAELERRGMRCKGLYRTCGVKSKVEWICVQFEQIPSSDVDIDLSDVHPMNIASVVKLYLRRLPEPLLSHELYTDWLRLDDTRAATSGTERTTLVNELRELVERLPDEAFTTLKFLVMHLNRVSWFEADNLMSVSNLAAVIAPSLMWPSNYGTHSAAISDAHRQSKAVEMLTRHAHEVFDVNFALDWRTFFDTHPNVPEPTNEHNSVGAIDRGISGTPRPEFCSDSADGDNMPRRQDSGDSRHAIVGDGRRGAGTIAAVDLSAEDLDDELVEDDDDDENEEVDELLEDDDDDEEEEEEELIMASADHRHRHGGQPQPSGGGSAKNGAGGGGAQMPSPAVDEKKQHHHFHSVFDKRLLVDSYSSSELECGSSAATHHQQLFRALHHPSQQQQQQQQSHQHSNGTTNANNGRLTGIGTISGGRPPAPPTTVPSAPQSPLPARSRQLSAAPRGSLPMPPGTAPQQRRVVSTMANNANNSNNNNGTSSSGISGNNKKFGERSYTTSILVSPHLRGMKEALAMDTGGGNIKKAAVQRTSPTPKLGLTQRHKSLEEMANCRLGTGTGSSNGGTKLGGKLFRALAGTGATVGGHGDSVQQKLSLAPPATVNDGATNTVAAATVNDRNYNNRYHHHYLQQQQHGGNNDRNMVLSGEVTVQLKKDQHFLANEERRQQRHPSCFKSAFLGTNDNDVSYV